MPAKRDEISRIQLLQQEWLEAETALEVDRKAEAETERSNKQKQANVDGGANPKAQSDYTRMGQLLPDS